MARARAAVVGLILLLVAAPANAAPLPPSFSLGELLGPVIEPLQPLTGAVGDLSEPITEPIGQLVDPRVGPVVDLLAPVTDPLLEPVEDLLAPVTDPLLGPVEEVVDPVTDPVDEVVDPLIDPDPQPDGGETPLGSLFPATGGGSVISVPSLGAEGTFESQPPSAADSIVSSAISLLPPRPVGVVVPPSLAQSLLSQILDWLSGVDAGSFLAAPFLGLRVLLRALASAGQGLLIPGMMLVVLALMARDRRILGTKTP